MSHGYVSIQTNVLVRELRDLTKSRMSEADFDNTLSDMHDLAEIQQDLARVLVYAAPPNRRTQANEILGNTSRFVDELKFLRDIRARGEA